MQRPCYLCIEQHGSSLQGCLYPASRLQTAPMAAYYGQLQVIFVAVSSTGYRSGARYRPISLPAKKSHAGRQLFAYDFHALACGSCTPTTADLHGPSSLVDLCTGLMLDTAGYRYFKINFHQLPVKPMVVV